MFPLFNSLPFHSNANPSSAPQQVMGNPGNFPNPMQIQAQTGMPNPQIAIPLGNSSAHFAPNQFFPMQAPQNMNYPVSVNQMTAMNNHPQSLPQSFAQSSVGGPPKFFNQNLNLGFPNPIQDMNQILQLQMLPSLYNQVVPASLNLPQNLAFVANSQPGNLNLHQNAAFAANTQLGFVDSSAVMQQSANANASNGILNAFQQLQGSSSLVQGFASVPPSQNQKNFHQPSKFQGSNRNVVGTPMQRNNGKSPQNKNFKRNAKHEAPRNGFVKPQFHMRQNKNGNFKSRNMQLRRGNDSSGNRQISDVNSAVQAQVEKKRRSISLNYTQKEIQEWREERRKNYPSKSNIEKKLSDKLTKPEVGDKVAKLRREQLKEILAKQAELGCEVAEIPSHYLSDSEQQLNETKESGRALSKKGKFQNKFNNKRGRFNQNDRFSYKKGLGNDDSSARSKNDCMAKKQRLANNNSVTHDALSKKRPTLLQKLLAADVRRDRHHLLQVFRFMVMNSFFKDWPDKPLKFPVVTVKETTNEDELTEGNSVEGKKNFAEGILGKIEEPIVSDDDDDDDQNGNEIPKGLIQVVNSGLEADSLGGEEPQEEEGEIID